MRVAAYHSTAAADCRVYHDRSDCPSGSRLIADNIAHGDGGRRRCKLCAARGGQPVTHSQVRAAEDQAPPRAPRRPAPVDRFLDTLLGPSREPAGEPS